jgi:hypothetical protein
VNNTEYCSATIWGILIGIRCESAWFQQ